MSEVPAKRVDSESTAALALISDLERAGALTPVSLTLPAGTTYETWLAIGEMLAVARNATAWAIGDWYVFGEAAYGLAAEGAELFGVARETVIKYGSVARAIPLTARYPLPLTLSHHRHVAPLPPKERDRWLKLALRESLTTNDLRAKLIAAKAIEKKKAEQDETPGTPLYTPKEALTAIRADTTWREVADSALEQLEQEIECPNCSHRFTP